MKYEYAPGATPLDPDEAIELIPIHITTHAELNAWEATNILKAEDWISSSISREILTIIFIKKLHIKMFDDTWKWAGKFRKSIKNIGVEPAKITTTLIDLLKDVEYQIANHSYSIDEIAYRFHHRLVWIHPFSNGNGRHARLMTDTLLMQNKQDRFTWGQRELGTNSSTRDKYIQALRGADNGNYTLLEKFVRS